MSRPRQREIDLTAATTERFDAAGRFFGIIDAPDAPLDVSIDDGELVRLGPGGSLHIPDGFSRLALLSSVTQTVLILVADEPQAISNIVTGSGGSPTVNVTVAETPSSTVATPAAVTVATANASTIAANADRKRISIYADENNAGPIFVQAVGAGAGRGIGIAAGTNQEFKTVAALDVRNDTGANATFSTFEEE